ncbi:sugar kinase [Brevibacillus fluminis]|uniref:Sugar kinase n=1 Tax=Brevibacillus fluminis TaxID=511487 RepID=A0A3M8DHZ0_9BACL|nr:sugar kinase [Brevibacillus fluminis]
MNPIELITFGESMVLFNPGKAGALRYVQHFHKQIGGAESNVAIGVQRLGHQAGWFSRLGNDEFGKFVLSTIRAEGVDTSKVIVDDRGPTGLYFKEKRNKRDVRVTYYRKGSAASFLSPDDLDESYLKQATCLHLTGITPVLSPTCRSAALEAVRIARQNGVMVSFDPNIRYTLWNSSDAKTTLCAIASQCDVVMPGLQEAQFLTGKESPRDISSYFLEQGVSAVILKLGEQGAYFAVKGHEQFVPAFPVDDVVDPVGAGDGFAAGVLAGRLKGWDWDEAVRLGNAVGAMVVQTDGDVEGLPAFEEVERFLQKPAADVSR